MLTMIYLQRLFYDIYDESPPLSRVLDNGCVDVSNIISFWKLTANVCKKHQSVAFRLDYLAFVHLAINTNGIVCLPTNGTKYNRYTFIGSTPKIAFKWKWISYHVKHYKTLIRIKHNQAIISQCHNCLNIQLSLFTWLILWWTPPITPSVHLQLKIIYKVFYTETLISRRIALISDF